MNAAVLDASVVVKLLIREADSPTAHSVLASLTRAVVPDWCTLECAHAVWKYVHRGDLDTETASANMRALDRLNLDTVSSQDLVSASMDLALEVNHSPYDCLYVLLAYAEGLPLVTADKIQHEIAVRALGKDRAILLSSWAS